MTASTAHPIPRQRAATFLDLIEAMPQAAAVLPAESNAAGVHALRRLSHVFGDETKSTRAARVRLLAAFAFVWWEQETLDERRRGLIPWPAPLEGTALLVLDPEPVLRSAIVEARPDVPTAGEVDRDRLREEVAALRGNAEQFREELGRVKREAYDGRQRLIRAADEISALRESRDTLQGKHAAMLSALATCGAKVTDDGPSLQIHLPPSAAASGELARLRRLEDEVTKLDPARPSGPPSRAHGSDATIARVACELRELRHDREQVASDLREMREILKAALPHLDTTGDVQDTARRVVDLVHAGERAHLMAGDALARHGVTPPPGLDARVRDLIEIAEVTSGPKAQELAKLQGKRARTLERDNELARILGAQQGETLRQAAQRAVDASAFERKRADDLAQAGRAEVRALKAEQEIRIEAARHEAQQGGIPAGYTKDAFVAEVCGALGAPTFSHPRRVAEIIRDLRTRADRADSVGTADKALRAEVELRGVLARIAEAASFAAAPTTTEGYAHLVRVVMAAVEQARGRNANDRDFPAPVLHRLRMRLGASCEDVAAVDGAWTPLDVEEVGAAELIGPPRARAFLEALTTCKRTRAVQAVASLVDSHTASRIVARVLR